MRGMKAGDGSVSKEEQEEEEEEARYTSTRAADCEGQMTGGKGRKEEGEKEVGDEQEKQERMVVG